MTSPYAGQLDRYIDSLYGSYLQTVRYRSKAEVLCPQCGGFKGPGYDECRSCNLIQGSAESLGDTNLLADRIATSVYAVQPSSQTLRVMYGYKDPGPTAETHRKVVKALLALAVKGHEGCLALASGLNVTSWAMPPSSLSSRRYGKPHPLHSIIQEVLPDIPEVRLSSTTTKNRNFDPNAFHLTESSDARYLGGNVLLIDDSWVTGGTAQSAAAALKLAGAQQVSIYCVSRIVDLNFLKTVSPGSVSKFNKFVHYIGGYCPWNRKRDIGNSSNLQGH